MRKKEGTRQRASGHAGGDAVRVAVRHWKDRGWHVVIGADDKRTARACSSQAEAERLAAHLIAQIEMGALEEAGPAPSRMGELMDRYLEMKERGVAENKSRRSTMTWVRNVTSTLRRHLGERLVVSVNRRTVVDYMNARRREDVADPTIKGEVNILGQMLRLAVLKGWWPGDAMRLTELTGHLGLEPAHEKHWLRADEVAPFLAVIDDEYFKVAAELALGLGMRIGEVLTRKWKDWDRRENSLTIGHRPEIGWRTKSGKERTVPVDAHLGTVLLAWWVRRGQPEPEAWLLPARDGERRRISGEGWFSKKTHEYCGTAGVTNVSFHVLRHSFASLALEAGVPLEYVSRILGHHSSAFTEKQYIHASQKKLMVEAEKMRSYLDTVTMKKKAQ